MQWCAQEKHYLSLHRVNYKIKTTTRIKLAEFKKKELFLFKQATAYICQEILTIHIDNSNAILIFFFS